MRMEEVHEEQGSLSRSNEMPRWADRYSRDLLVVFAQWRVAATSLEDLSRTHRGEGRKDALKTNCCASWDVMERMKPNSTGDQSNASLNQLSACHVHLLLT